MDSKRAGRGWDRDRRECSVPSVVYCEKKAVCCKVSKITTKMGHMGQVPMGMVTRTLVAREDCLPLDDGLMLCRPWSVETH